MSRLVLRRYGAGRLCAFFLIPFLMTCFVQGGSAQEYRIHLSRLIRDYHWSEALAVSRRALEQYPSDPALVVAAGALMFQLGDRQGAERLSKIALSLAITDPDLIWAVAELKLGVGEVEKAVRLYGEALRRRPDHPLVHHRLAKLLFAQGQERAALAHARRAVEGDGTRSEYRRFYATLLDRAGRSQEAYQQLQVAHRHSPEDAGILLRLADSERTAGRDMQAMEYLEMATATDPENPLYHRQLSRVYGKLDMREEGLEAERKAQDLERAFESYARAVVMTSQGEFCEAADHLSSPVKENPEFLTGALLLADLYRRLGRSQEALSLYLDIVRRDPTRGKAREESAWLLTQQGDLEAALGLLKGSRDQSMNEYLLEGYRKQVRSDWEGAISEFKKVESQYPLHPRVLQQISLCLHSMGRAQEALDYLKKAHSAQPENPEMEENARRIRFQHGMESEKQGNWQAALSIFHRLRHEDEECAAYMFHEAYCFQNLGKYEEAVAIYEKGLQFEPDAPWARINLAACFYMLSRFDESARQWEYLVGRSDEPEYRYNLGLARIRQWRLMEGWDLVRQAAAAGFVPAEELLKSSGCP